MSDSESSEEISTTSKKISSPQSRNDNKNSKPQKLRSRSRSRSPLDESEKNGAHHHHLEKHQNKKPHHEFEKNEAETAESASEYVSIPEVHSANEWESVDLGDEARKAKFLRLMGAAKKEHTGRFVIGERSDAKSPENEAAPAPAPHHTRTSCEEEKLEEKLENEFKRSLADHLKQKDKRHCGLGFQAESEIKADSSQAKEPTEGAAAPHPHDVRKDHQMHFVSADGKKHVDL